MERYNGFLSVKWSDLMDFLSAKWDDHYYMQNGGDSSLYAKWNG